VSINILSLLFYLGVLQMFKGEICSATFPPELAYGKDGLKDMFVII
jgi:FKBP-type peptidyl-prolyl cis-trans isomerase